MQHELFTDDPYRRSCQATVIDRDHDSIALDATVCYPTGGGQPGDTGRLTLPDGQVLTILDTRRDRETGCIRHRLSGSTEDLPAPGSTVEIAIDWQRRHRHMRMHTALHLLSAVVKAGVTGGNLGADSGRLDFDTGGAGLDPTEIEQRLAERIEADLPVRTRLIAGEQLRAQPELIKTLSVSPPLDAPMIRLIEIVGADLQPCGGTHVARTGEIGRLRVAKIESKGSRNRRVVLAFVDD